MDNTRARVTTAPAKGTRRLGLGLCTLALLGGLCGMEAQTLDFPTIVEWTNGTLPHYACGAPGEQACFTGCANSNGISLRWDSYTGQINCDLPSPVCTMLGGLITPNPHDITFLVMTDVHLRNGWGITDLEHSLHTTFMKKMGTNGWNWNVSNAGFPADPMARPLAVVSTGDETNDGQQTSLGAFRLLYEAGWSSDSTWMPLFPGYGNHDMQNDCEFDNCAKRMLDYSSNTASCNPNGMDPQSRNYSWDWGKFHLVQLNSWAGDTLAGYNNSYTPKVKDTHGSGLPWFIADLQSHVGNSGRPVILFQHYGWDPLSTQLNSDGTPSWWSDTDRQTFLNIIKDYNVVAIITGHDHNLGSYGVSVTDSSGNAKMLDDFVGGTGGQNGTGEFFMVRLTDQFLDLMPVQWTDPLVNPNRASPYPVQMGITGRPAFFNNVQGCRKWIGPPLHSTPLTIGGNYNSVTIKNNTSNTIPGPFALEYDWLNNPVPAASGQILFTANCAQGPLYVLGNTPSLAPGESETIALAANPGGYPARVVTIGGDYLQSTPNPVVAPVSGTTPVHLTSAFGAAIPFSLRTDQQWLKVTADSSQTPATLTVSIDVSKVPQGGNQNTGNIDIFSTNTAYASIKIPVSIAPASVSFNSPDSELITVDNQSVSTPVTFQWQVGSEHKISAQTYTVSTGVQDRFLGWSQPGSTFNLIVSGPAVYDVRFQQYILLNTIVDTANGGTVTPNISSPDGYYAKGTGLTLTATPNAGYVFSGFENQPPGVNPIHITLDAYREYHVKFLQAGSYTVSTTVGAAGSETIDGVTRQGPQTVAWAGGSQHTISVPAVIPAGAGVQYVFQQWSDAVTALSRTVTAGPTASYLAQYQQQFQIALSANPAGGGTVSGGGWLNANASATLTAAAANGFSFAGFSGGIIGAQSPLTITVTKPENVSANFIPLTPALSVSAGTHTNSQLFTTMNFVLTNTGAGAAEGATIDSVSAVVQNGSGTVALISVPLAATLLPGHSATLPYVFSWPATAVRVAFTVHFTANSGAYSGKSTFYVVR